MYIDKLISQTRYIAKTHYEGMKRLEMGESDPAMTKIDLFEKLKAFIPEMTEADMAPLYSELQQNGYATLITNDTVTFSKDFIGE